MKLLLKIIATPFIFIALITYTAFSWGIVAKTIATWYIIPIFPKFPLLTWYQYAGIIFFIHSIAPTSSNNIKDEYKEEYMDLIKFLINPWTLLLSAWTFKQLFF